MTPIKLWSNPSEDQLESKNNGIAQVVHHLYRLLPSHGFEYVQSPDVADLIVKHAGAQTGPQADIAHCHGLMPTAMRKCDAWEYAVNKDVTDNLMHAKVITAPSEWVAEVIRRDMRARPFVVPWGIEPSYWTPGRTRNYVLWAKGRAHGVNDPTFMDKLASMSLGTTFVSTFGEPYANVKIIGTQSFEKMTQWIRSANVYLATTRETFGIQTLEAMACGVPVLGFDWAATPEIVEHGVTGYLAAPGDFEDLLEGLNYCIANRRRLSEAARAVALTYTWEKVAGSMALAYKEALTPHSGPQVSIVIPCYNYANWVSTAIQSALDQQNAASIEVIVVNDASTDNSKEVIESFGDSITAIHKERNEGVAAARNSGASIARGEFVAFLDADDKMEPKWLSYTLKAMSDRRVGISYTGLQLWTTSGEKRFSKNWPPSTGDVGALLRCDNSVPTCCLIRKEAFDRAGGYRSRFEPTEDGELWTRIAECGYDVKCASPKPLFSYRVGHASLSRGIPQLPDYKSWHLPTIRGKPPFAAVKAERSYPVRDYDRPLIRVIVLHPVHHKEEHLLDTLDMLVGQTFRFWDVRVCGGGDLPKLWEFPFVKIVDNPLEELRSPLVFVVISGDNIFEADSLRKVLAFWQDHGIVTDLRDAIPREWISEIGVNPEDTQGTLTRRLAESGMLTPRKEVP